MKKMKKILAMLLALTMVMGMGLTSMAADKKPEKIDTATATIEKVKDANATIKVYQIVDAVYNDNGLVEYTLDNGLTSSDIADIYNPTYAEIMAIAKKDLTEYTGLEDTENVDVSWVATLASAATDTEPALYSYTATLEAGMYLVEIVGTGAVVYNPMIISIGYDEYKSGDSNELKPGEVTATSNWVLNDVVLAAKSSEISFEKTVSDTEAEVGDTVTFKIETTIPSYSAEYVKDETYTVTFKITDTLVSGLEYVAGTPVIKVGSENLASENYTIDPEALTASTEGFTITFDPEYVLGLAGADEDAREVVVTYDAKITEEALTTNAENIATLTYSHKPGGETTTKTDPGYVYTFEIDGIIKKVKEDGATALENAEFTLYRKLEDGKLSDVFGTDLSDEYGDIEFKGLDSDIIYYLKETNAPDEYSLNDTIYEIKITDVAYDEVSEKITAWKITVTPMTKNDSGKYVADQIKAKEYSYTVTYTEGEDGEVETNVTLSSDAVMTTITNIKLNALPSTGGIGTTIFTVAGCGIMIAAAYFFFASRKKES